MGGECHSTSTILSLQNDVSEGPQDGSSPTNEKGPARSRSFKSIRKRGLR